MRCMKCGKTMEEQGAFCESCRAVMERYPVKPGAKVVIPGPRAPRRTNRPQRKQHTADEVIAAQRRKIRRLAWAVVFLVVLLAASTAIVVWRLQKEQNMVPLGSNYSTATESVSRETLPQT